MKLFGVRLAFLLRKNNRKLGPDIYSFSLPAVETCPGRTALCEKHCYARHGHYYHSSVQTYLRRCARAARGAWFVARMIAEIKIRGVKTLRLHASGDFDSVEYTQAIGMIIRACPATRFFVYSRSWRDYEIAKELAKLSRLPNLRLWYSCDAESGAPSIYPKRVRLAWMQTSEEDSLTMADLVFRVDPLRRRLMKFASGVLVCPKENGTEAELSCSTCRVCWADLKQLDARDYRRVPA